MTKSEREIAVLIIFSNMKAKINLANFDVRKGFDSKPNFSFARKLSSNNYFSSRDFDFISFCVVFSLGIKIHNNVGNSGIFCSQLNTVAKP